MCGGYRRVARAYAELLTPCAFDLTTFANDEGYDELVLARGIPFRTVCEHHLLPFSGVAHVGYLPGERIVGLSKLARVIEHFAASPARASRATGGAAHPRDAAIADPGQDGGVPVVRAALQPVRQRETALVVQFAEARVDPDGERVRAQKA